jgi:hypothetical protein
LPVLAGERFDHESPAIGRAFSVKPLKNIHFHTKILLLPQHERAASTGRIGVQQGGCPNEDEQVANRIDGENVLPLLTGAALHGIAPAIFVRNCPNGARSHQYGEMHCRRGPLYGWKVLSDTR